MNLADRRIVAEFEKTHYQALLDKIRPFTNAPVQVEWETLCIPDQSHLFLECWGPVYFEPLAEALETVGRDDLGKEALGSSLKSIIIQNKNDCHSYSNWAKFENGVLTLDHLPTTNIDDAKERKKSLVSLLEKAL